MITMINMMSEDKNGNLTVINVIIMILLMNEDKEAVPGSFFHFAALIGFYYSSPPSVVS